jgi:hypothetical protein
MRDRKLLAVIILSAGLLLAGCNGGNAAEAPAPEASAPDASAPDAYTTPSGAFTFQLPDSAQAAAGEDPRCGPAALCWAAGDYTLIVEEADAGDVGVADDADAADLAAYVNIVLPDLLAGTEGTQLLGQTEVTLSGGLPAMQIEVSTNDGAVRVLEQWALSEGRLLRLYFTGFSDGFDETVRPIAEVTFQSVAATGE